MLKIVEKTKIWFAISLTIIFIGIGAMCVKGLNFGIDFKGGTEITIDMGKSFNKAKADAIIKKYDSNAQSNQVGTSQLQIKTKSLTEDNIASMFKEIKSAYKLKTNKVASQDNIGPSLGNEMKQKALLAIVIANVCVLLYVAWRFEFKFAISAIIALVHDVLITLAVYAVFSIPVDMAFIAAMLTIIGYSLSDTIVVFDRIRENEKYARKTSIEKLVNASITQTILRSIYTVMTVLITVSCVHIFVPTIRNFTLPLLVGITSGCYSSIFIASPMWVILKKYVKKRKRVAA